MQPASLRAGDNYLNGLLPKERKRKRRKKKDGESHARAAADDTGSCSQIDWAKNSKYIRGGG